MHYYFVTGESSGDLYAAKLIAAIRSQNKDVQFSGWGGEKMLAQGANLVRHIKGRTYSGFLEVLLNIRKIRQDLVMIEEDLAKKQPTAVILIDYAGFNLRVAKIASKLGIRVFWFVAPQIWVWRKYRIHALRRYVNELFVILPFEPDFYQARKLSCHYYGHPLLDLVAEFKQHHTLHAEQQAKTHIALLPGSRTHEIQQLLPLMLQVAAQFPQQKFIVIATKNVEEKLYQSAQEQANVQVLFDQMYSVLASAQVALVASGTATLEVALFKVPQVVCYRLNQLTYYLIKLMVKMPYCSLVNIICDKYVVKELLQYDCTVEKLLVALTELLQPHTKEKIQREYNYMISQLGQPGCFTRVAEKMLTVSLSNRVKT